MQNFGHVVSREYSRIFSRRPGERRDPYAAAEIVFPEVVDDLPLTTNIRGYGSLRSQGRRLRVERRRRSKRLLNPVQ